MLAVRIRTLAVLAAVAAALARPARAQGEVAPGEIPASPAPTDRWRVSVSTGWGGLVEVVDWYGELLGGTAQQGRYQLGVRVDRDLGRASFGFGYTQQHWHDVSPSDSLDTTVHVFVADGRFRWLRAAWVDLYSGGGIGFASWTQTATRGEPQLESGASLAFQLRLLGVDAGWEHVRLWGELGLGFEGLALVGASWRF